MEGYTTHECEWLGVAICVPTYNNEKYMPAYNRYTLEAKVILKVLNGTTGPPCSAIDNNKEVQDLLYKLLPDCSWGHILLSDPRCLFFRVAIPKNQILYLSLWNFSVSCLHHINFIIVIWCYLMFSCSNEKLDHIPSSCIVSGMHSKRSLVVLTQFDFS